MKHFILAIAITLWSVLFSFGQNQQYSVQIGAYWHKQYVEFNGLDSVFKNTDSLKITRYYKGHFDSKSEAESLSKQLKTLGYSEAHVVSLDTQSVLNDPILRPTSFSTDPEKKESYFVKYQKRNQYKKTKHASLKYEKIRRRKNGKPIYVPYNSQFCFIPHISKGAFQYGIRDYNYMGEVLRSAFNKNYHSHISKWNIGARFSYNASPYFRIETGLVYSDKGIYQQSRSDLSYSYSGKYLDLPLLMRVNFVDSRLKPYINGGAIINFNASSSSYYSQILDGTETRIQLRTFNPGVSLTWGLGLECEFQNNWSGFIETSMDQGLHSIVKTKAIEITERHSVNSLRISFGGVYYFNL